MAEYALTLNPDIVIRTADGLNIPNDEANAYWREYQAWIDAGGVPDPAPIVLASPSYSWGETTLETLGGPYYVGA
jgi:hypothetical protein